MASVRADELVHRNDLTVSEEAAWEAFYACHYVRLVSLAALVCGDVTPAEDIVQTALERAWRSRGALRDADRFRSWLDQIVVREAARERRFRINWFGRLGRMPTVTEIDVPGGDIVDRRTTAFPDVAA